MHNTDRKISIPTSVTIYDVLYLDWNIATPISEDQMAMLYIW